MNQLLTQRASTHSIDPAGKAASVLLRAQRKVEPAPSHRARGKERAKPRSQPGHETRMHQEEQAHDPQVLPIGVCPEGVPVERVSTETLRLVEVALPQQGRALLAHLLCYATCRPKSTLPPGWSWLDSEVTSEPSALVVVRSLKAVAQAEGAPCGPDRYYQLVLVLEALQVLKRRVHRSREAPHTYVTVLSVRLTPPTSPLSSVLRSCRETAHSYANPKVKRLLMQASTRLHTTLHEATVPQLHQLVSQMERVVEHYEQQGLPQAPLLALVQQVLNLLLPPDLSSLEGVAREAEMSHQEWQMLSPSDQDSFALSPNTPQVETRFPETPIMQASRKQHHDPTTVQRGIDPEAARESFLPDVGKKQADEGIRMQLLSVDDAWVDHQDTQRGTHGKKLAHTGKKQLRRSFPASRESEAESVPVVSFLPDTGKKLTSPLSINDSSFNTLFLENEESLIDTTGAPTHRPETIQEIRQQASHYAQLFDGEERWMGKLVNCVKQFPPQILRLAAIATFTRQYHPDARNRPRSPGAWFCRTCEHFALHPEQVPEDVRLWAATTLGDEAIIAALAQGQRAPGAPAEPLVARPKKSVRKGNGSNLPACWLPSSAPEEGYLDQAEAELLGQRVQRDVDAEQARVQVQAEIQVLQEQPDGRWMVLLVWEDGVEVPLTSEAEWVHYWTGLPESCERRRQEKGGRP